MEAKEKPGEVRRPLVYRVCVLGSVKRQFGGHRNFDHTSREDGGLNLLNVAVVLFCRPLLKQQVMISCLCLNRT